ADRGRTRHIKAQHPGTVWLRAKNHPTHLIRFPPAGLVASLPRMTVTEAFGSVKVVFMVAVTRDFLGGPSGSALPPSPLGCQCYCSPPNEITSTVPPKNRSESVAASWNMMR